MESLQELDHVEVIRAQPSNAIRGVVGVIKDQVARIDLTESSQQDEVCLSEGDTVQIMVKRHKQSFVFTTKVQRCYDASILVATPDRLEPFERRNDLRENCDLRAKWCHPDHKSSNPARVLDISMGGLLLESETEPPPIGDISVEFHIPDVEIPIKTSVGLRSKRQTSRQNRDVWLCGVEFQGIALGDRRRLWAYILQIQRQRANARDAK